MKPRIKWRKHKQAMTTYHLAYEDDYRDINRLKWPWIRRKMFLAATFTFKSLSLVSTAFCDNIYQPFTEHLAYLKILVLA